jgi:hypothetical protein
MNTAARLSVEAVVDDRERPAMNAAAEQLAECMAAATGSAWPVRLHFRAALQHVQAAGAPTVIVTSLLRDLAVDDLPGVERRLRNDLAALCERGFAQVFICTVFRHVPRDAQFASIAHPTQGAASLTERIRRLNLLAIELSHDLGIALCDLDRVFAHLGARALKTDYRLDGAVAAEVAAHIIVATILEVTLGDLVDPDVLERARRFHGNLWEINQLLRRR